MLLWQSYCEGKTALLKIVNASSKVLGVQQIHSTKLYNGQVVRQA